MNSDPIKPTISSSEMALLSLPPPPPPPSPPPAPMTTTTTTIVDDPTLQMFYAQLNSNPVTESTCSSPPEKTGTTKSELHSHHHKEKKTVNTHLDLSIVPIGSSSFRFDSCLETIENITNEFNSKMDSRTSRTAWYRRDERAVRFHAPSVIKQTRTLM